MALGKDERADLGDDVDLDRDRVLIERAQAGDSAAFGLLYARYYERLAGFCLRRLHDRHEAEDAAQEAFARAWKALPRFGGDKRFYPWLTVIAGNICTDLLRRRWRTRPTDDLELTARHSLGALAPDTSEDLVLAAVDGQLVQRALERLSRRHRHVLALREGSGWSYQQIAEHEGVEVGTVETLLWRARQALKREFAAVSDSKGALAGFLAATAAPFRRALLRAARRGAAVQQQAGGGSGGMGLRNALTGAAVAGAAVAAAFVAPHALEGHQDHATGAAAAPAGGARAAPLRAGAAGSSSTVSRRSTEGSGGSDTSSTPPVDPGSAASAGSVGRSGVTTAGGAGGRGGGQGGGGGTQDLGGALTQGVTQATGGLNAAVNGLGQTVNGLTNGVTEGVTNTVDGVTGGITGTLPGAGRGVSGLLGGASGSPGSGPSGSNSSTTTTTTTTLPNPLDELGNLLGR